MRSLVPFLWYVAIFLSSSKSVDGDTVLKNIHRRFPGEQGDKLAAIWKRLWWIPVKGWHATEFAIFYALLRYAGRSREAALSLVAVGAALDEYHQTKVDKRTGTPRDVLIDFGGALAAVGVESLIQRNDR